MLILTKKAGVRYLHDFNLQLRYGTQWDPTNTLAMINHIRSKGLGDNLDFELGNGMIMTKLPMALFHALYVNLYLKGCKILLKNVMTN